MKNKERWLWQGAILGLWIIVIGESLLPVNQRMGWLIWPAAGGALASSFEYGLRLSNGRLTWRDIWVSLVPFSSVLVPFLVAMSWNSDKHSFEENARWSLLRAIEWDSWPFFISQPIVPIAFYYIVWWKIIIGLIFIQFLWTAFIRTKVSVILANIAPIIVLTKWIICPVMAYLIFSRGQIWLAFLALLWPFVMLRGIMRPVWVAMPFIFKPFHLEVGYQPLDIIEERFMVKLGYINLFDEDGEYPSLKNKSTSWTKEQREAFDSYNRKINNLPEPGDHDKS